MCQQQRELHRQVDWLFVSSIVRELPFCGLGVKHHLLGKTRQSGFDISGSSRSIAGQNIAPVTLSVNQHLLLPQLHQSVADGSIAMWMELHGLTHDVGHLIIPSVFHAPHRVQDTSLNRLQSVDDMGHGSLQDYIRRIIQEPVLIHTAQLMPRIGIVGIGWLVVRMTCCFVRNEVIYRLISVFTHKKRSKKGDFSIAIHHLCANIRFFIKIFKMKPLSLWQFYELNVKKRKIYGTRRCFQKDCGALQRVWFRVPEQ